MNQYARRSTRKDVVTRARIRLWCDALNKMGRAAGIRSIDKIGDAIQRELPPPRPAWLALWKQLPEALRGVAPRRSELKSKAESETPLEWLVRSIDSLERFRGAKAVFESPLLVLLSSSAGVPHLLSETIDCELRSLALVRMSLDASKASWGLPANSNATAEELELHGFRRVLSFERSVDFCLGRTAGCSHDRLLRCLYVLALLHLEAWAVRRIETARTIERAIDRFTSSPEYEEAFGKFAVEFRASLRSRVLWRPLDLMVDEPGRPKEKTPRKDGMPDQQAPRVCVDPMRIGCVIVPFSQDPTRMSAPTYWSVSSRIFGSG